MQDTELCGLAAVGFGPCRTLGFATGSGLQPFSDVQLIPRPTSYKLTATASTRVPAVVIRTQPGPGSVKQAVVNCTSAGLVISNFPTALSNLSFVGPALTSQPAVTVNSLVTNALISKCSFASIPGGALGTQFQSSVTVAGCSFSRLGRDTLLGAAINAQSSSLTVQQSSFADLRSQSGAIYLLASTATIANSTFTRLTASQTVLPMCLAGSTHTSFLRAAESQRCPRRSLSAAAR